MGRVSRRVFFAFVVTCLIQAARAGPAAAQEPAAESGSASGSPPPSTMEAFLITIGPGRQVWERFGHNAIWVRDTLRGIDRAYNYGMFSFDDPGFLTRFVRGEMDYWMQGFDTEHLLRAYEAADRSIWVQELDLSSEQIEELYRFELWNELPENRFYRYDYYRDNCSTRVRDALDHVLDGQLRDQAERIETTTTYRSHFRRLMAPDPLIYTGGSFAIGPATDRPISVWEQMFLPVRMMEYLREVRVDDGEGGDRPLVKREFTVFESTLGPEPEAPPDWRLQYLALGAGLAGLFVLFGWFGSERRVARLLTAVACSAWALLLGVGGVFMLGIWFLTAHWAGYRNENLFFFNVAALALVPLIPLAALGRKEGATRWARRLSVFVAGVALFGLIVQPLPWFTQVNAEIIAVALPPTLAMAWVVLQLTRKES